MLLTIKGVSWDKAVSIQKIYPTPRLLWEAYNEHSSEEAKKRMLYVALQDNISRRKIGKALSETIYDVWGSTKGMS